MRIKKVTIDGMHKVNHAEYDLSGVNYLIGENGAGKSTVLQAIQLALLGYIPGFGKSSKSSIFKHCNGNVMSVSVEMEDENTNAVTVKRAWAGSIKKCTSSIEVTPNTFSIESLTSKLELPIFNFAEFLGLSANKLKDWFIDFLPSAGDAIEWDKILIDSLNGLTILDDTLMTNTLDHINNCKLSGLDQVREANAYFKSELSGAKAELKRLQNTIQSLYFYDESDLSGLSIDVVEAELTAIKTKLLDASKNQEKLARKDRIMSDLNSLNAQLSASPETTFTELCNKIDELRNMYSHTLESITDLKAQLTAIDNDIAPKIKAVKAGDICPVTGCKCSTISEQLASIQSDIDRLSPTRQSLIDSISDLQKNQNDLVKDIATAEHQQKAIAEQSNRRAMLNKQLDDLSDICIDTIDTSELLNKQSELNDKLVKLKSNKQYNDLIDKLSIEVAKVEQNVAIYTKWAKITDANNLQTEMMTKPFESISNTLSKCLSTVLDDESIEAKFYLTSEANSFSFGIERNGKYLSFDLLSSGEKCSYTVALMTALISSSDNELQLILIDDLIDHLDDANADTLFSGLQKLSDMYNIQYIAAGVKPCISAARINIISI